MIQKYRTYRAVRVHLFCGKLSCKCTLHPKKHPEHFQL